MLVLVPAMCDKQEENSEWKFCRRGFKIDSIM